ncbi:MAG: selenocysteine-specific translation elongation factor [candidate division WOR-3 bacterium]
MHIVIGTAGHIDHGKSLLTKALTGTDPDRLKEEKERGMTTDLGFAFFGDNATIIDVPGHEKFVRHMLAGASTIDLVLLVIAADDGIMPQTIEHFEITKLLGIKKGIIVITKKDLVDEEWLELIKLDIKKLVKGSFLQDAPILAVSALTGEGIPELKNLLQESIKNLESKPDRGVFRMPIDRCFTIKGFGTIVAGTILSGSVKLGDEVCLLPQNKVARVRGIQIHNQSVNVATIGARAGINLIGIEKEEIMRGNVLAAVGYYKPTLFINASLYLLPSAGESLKNMTRVRLHLGTAEIMARVSLLDKKELAPQEEGLVQLRLETPTVCDWNDRFVIRRYSPARTIGGGVVLEANPDKARRFDNALLERLSIIRSGDQINMMEQYLLKANFVAKPIETIAKETALTAEEAQAILKKLIDTGKVKSFNYEGKKLFVHNSYYVRIGDMIMEKLKEFHSNNPLRLDLRKAELLAKLDPVPAQPGGTALFNERLAELISSGQIVSKDDKLRLATHTIKFSASDQPIVDKIERIYLESKFTTPTIDELKKRLEIESTRVERLTKALLDIGKLVEVGEGIILHHSNIEQAQEKLNQFFSTKSELTVSEFRQMLGTSRKYAVPLLNYFDRKGVTQRRGEIRLKRSK